MRVSVIVPWRAGCPHREAAWDWVWNQYKEFYPDWQVIEGDCDGPGPWVKARAVADGLSRAKHRVLVIADADVWCYGLEQATEELRPGGWVMPHRYVLRLKQRATERLHAGDDPADVAQAEHCDEKPYIGIRGGGIVVLERKTYDRAPLDARFVGWGQEDEAWGKALRTLVGKPVCLSWDLLHLWHPPAKRKTRRTGNDEGDRLLGRYIAAKRPEVMAALVDEGRAK